VRHAQQSLYLVAVGEVLRPGEQGIILTFKVSDPDPIAVLGFGQNLGLSAVARPDLVTLF
jgi:hypothetical protein